MCLCMHVQERPDSTDVKTEQLCGGTGEKVLKDMDPSLWRIWSGPLWSSPHHPSSDVQCTEPEHHTEDEN